MPDWNPIVLIVVVVVVAALAALTASRMANRRSAIGLYDTRTAADLGLTPPSGKPGDDAAVTDEKPASQPGPFTLDADDLGRPVALLNSGDELLADLSVTATDNYGGRAQLHGPTLAPGARLSLDLPGWADHETAARKVWLQPTRDANGKAQPAGLRPADYDVDVTVAYRTESGEAATASLRHHVRNRVRFGILVRVDDT